MSCQRLGASLLLPTFPPSAINVRVLKGTTSTGPNPKGDLKPKPGPKVRLCLKMSTIFVQTR